MELMPYSPNWAAPVTERLEWLTDVIEGHDWTEERTPLRSRPRRTLEHALLLQGHDAGTLDALLWRWQAEQMLTPIWTDPQRLTAELTAGATAIPAETAGYDYEDSGRAVLWRRAESWELVDVDSVGASELTLAAPTAATWPAGTRVYPVRSARLDESAVAVSRVTAGVVQATLRWEVEPAAGSAVPGTTLYRGVEVFDRRPNWISPLPLEYRRNVQRLDYQLGAVAVDDHAGLPATLRTYRTLLRDRAEIAAWRGWLQARQGRYSPVWTPSWTQDLVQSGYIGAADTALPVRALDAAARYQLQAGRQDIAIRHRPTGAWLYRRIESVAAGGTGEEILTLDAALGVAAPAGALDPICWLALSRLEADAVEIAWHTAGVAESTLQTRSVRE